jgi:hypothetical protein
VASFLLTGRLVPSAWGLTAVGLSLGLSARLGRLSDRRFIWENTAAAFGRRFPLEPRLSHGFGRGLGTSRGARGFDSFPTDGCGQEGGERLNCPAGLSCRLLPRRYEVFNRVGGRGGYSRPPLEAGSRR